MFYQHPPDGLQLVSHQPFCGHVVLDCPWWWANEQWMTIFPTTVNDEEMSNNVGVEHQSVRMTYSPTLCLDLKHHGGPLFYGSWATGRTMRKSGIWDIWISTKMMEKQKMAQIFTEFWGGGRKHPELFQDFVACFWFCICRNKWLQ